MSGRTILLVEDNPHIRDAFTVLLEDSGYRVHAVETGAEAIRSSSNSPPDLILLDLGLPDMNGLEVARAIKLQLGAQHTRIVALTGHVLEADRDACVAAGCSGYLTKPIAAAELLAALPTYLND